MLADIQTSLLAKARTFREENTYAVTEYSELVDVVQNGWAEAWWCGSAECEAKVKEDTKATPRCIPLEQPGGKGVCVVCKEPATQKVIFARAY